MISAAGSHNPTTNQPQPDPGLHAGRALIGSVAEGESYEKMVAPTETADSQYMEFGTGSGGYQSPGDFDCDCLYCMGYLYTLGNAFG
jgi:hypothetical protein